MFFLYESSFRTNLTAAAKLSSYWLLEKTLAYSELFTSSICIRNYDGPTLRCPCPISNVRAVLPLLFLKLLACAFAACRAQCRSSLFYLEIWETLSILAKMSFDCKWRKLKCGTRKPRVGLESALWQGSSLPRACFFPMYSFHSRYHSMAQNCSWGTSSYIHIPIVRRNRWRGKAKKYPPPPLKSIS